jgi:hypothetical protein
MRITNFNKLLSFSNWSKKSGDEKLGVILTVTILLASVTLICVSCVLSKKKLSKFKTQMKMEKVYKLYELEHSPIKDPKEEDGKKEDTANTSDFNILIH